MNYQKFMEQLKRVLVEHGVKSLGSCGCCDGTWVSLEGGGDLAFLEFDGENLSASSYEHKDGKCQYTKVSA